MNRLINYCSILLTPVLVVIGSTAVANVNYWDDKDGSGWVIHGHENATSPGGFSSVAEPAGPVDPEAAKRAAEEYAQKCILPRVEVLMTMGPGQHWCAFGCWSYHGQ